MPDTINIVSLRQASPERVSIALSNGEEIASTVGVVAELRLYRGQELDGEKLECVRSASALALLKTKALEILSRRPLSAKELNDKLSVSHGFMDSASGCYAPVLFLITDGYPTDDTDNGDNGINLLKKNNWYKAAIRVAIAIGDDANKSLCENFTGNPETVVVAHNSVFLKKVIKKIAVTSSQVASSGRSRTDSETTDPNTVESTVGNKQVGTIIKEIPEDDDDDFEW